MDYYDLRDRLDKTREPSPTMSDWEAEQWIMSLLAGAGMGPPVLESEARGGRGEGYEECPCPLVLVESPMANSILLEAFSEALGPGREEEAKELAQIGSKAIMAARENQETQIRDRDRPPRPAPGWMPSDLIESSREKGIEFDEEKGYICGESDCSGVEDNFGRPTLENAPRRISRCRPLPRRDKEFADKLRLGIDSVLNRNRIPVEAIPGR
jgi:hypothetical protein